MAPSVFLSLAAALLLVAVTHANIIPKPEAPFSLMFAQDHLHTALRSKSYKPKTFFKGTYMGKYSQPGTSGRFRGGFSGVKRWKRVYMDFYGYAKGQCDIFGSKGGYSVDYSGKFHAVGSGKGYRANWGGKFDLVYDGKFAGLPKTAKVVGKFSGSFKNGKFVVREKARFNARIGKKRVKGVYKAFFNGKKFAAGVTGTINGKKFYFKYEGMLEGIEKLFKNEGTYSVTANGKTKSGKFRSSGMMPSEGMLAAP